MVSTVGTTSSTPESATLVGETWLKPGVKAVLRCLAKFPQLNGQQVEVVSWNAEKQRWKCLLPKGGDVNVFESNLEPAELAPKEIERLTKLFEDGCYFTVWQALHGKAAAPPQLKASLESQLKSGTYSEIVEGRIELVEMNEKGNGYRAAKKVRQGDALLFDTSSASVRIPRDGVAQGLNISSQSEDPFQQMARYIKQNVDISFIEQSIMRINAGSASDGRDRLRRILETSTFECAREPGRMALFAAAARFNHSCCPNAYADASTSVCVVRALRDIHIGEEVCISYVPVSDSIQTRRDKLRSYHFECDCDRCQAEGQKDPQSMVQCSCGQVPFCIHENARLYQSCEHCCGTFDRDESVHRLSQVSEVNQKSAELHKSPLEYSKQLTSLESVAWKGAKNGIPHLHIAAMALFNNLARVHYQLAIREDGGTDPNSLEAFHRYMKQMIDVFEERHTTWTNQRDVDYFQVLHMFLAKSPTLSETDRRRYTQKLADACQVCFGQASVPESMVK